MRPHTADSFWKRVSPADSKGCRLWTLRRVKGYGILTYQGEDWRAHRLAYTLAIGPIPKGLLVRHTCDNPPCCNPAHLLVGSSQDNSDDMTSRGRQAHLPGELGSSAVLTELQASEVWRAHTAGESYASIGERLGVSTATVQDITSRRTWAYLGEGRAKRPRHLTAKRIKALRALPCDLRPLSRCDKERYRNLRKLGLSRSDGPTEVLTSEGLDSLASVSNAT